MGALIAGFGAGILVARYVYRKAVDKLNDDRGKVLALAQEVATVYSSAQVAHRLAVVHNEQASKAEQRAQVLRDEAMRAVYGRSTVVLDIDPDDLPN